MPNVDDPTTNPFTNERIEQVSPSVWPNLTLPKLYDQLTILQNRKAILQRQSMPSVVLQIERGIAQLKAIIQEKENGASGRTSRKR